MSTCPLLLSLSKLQIGVGPSEDGDVDMFANYPLTEIPCDPERMLKEMRSRLLLYKEVLENRDLLQYIMSNIRVPELLKTPDSQRIDAECSLLIYDDDDYEEDVQEDDRKLRVVFEIIDHAEKLKPKELQGTSFEQISNKITMSKDDFHKSDMYTNILSNAFWKFKKQKDIPQLEVEVEDYEFEVGDNEPPYIQYVIDLNSLENNRESKDFLEKTILRMNLRIFNRKKWMDCLSDLAAALSYKANCVPIPGTFKFENIQNDTLSSGYGMTAKFQMVHRENAPQTLKPLTVTKTIYTHSKELRELENRLQKQE
jgi:hypothetical protein